MTSAPIYHYSAKPFTLDYGHAYPERMGMPMKPSGFWWSVGESWAEWCRGEGFNVPSLAHRYEICLKTDARILRIATPEDLNTFSRVYGVPCYNSASFTCPDWGRLAEEGYQGVEIAPYQWSARFSLMWYYSWDVASGVVWDLSAIDRLKISTTDVPH